MAPVQIARGMIWKCSPSRRAGLPAGGAFQVRRRQEVRVPDVAAAGSVAALRRHPVKSMLGEELPEAELGPRGVAGDRALALVDLESGQVASAKEPRLWKRLLACSASGAGDEVVLVLPGGERLPAGDPGVDGRLSALLGRRVALRDTPPAAPELQRAVPEEVLREGVDAAVETVTLEMGQAAPGGTFFDFAPLHLITRATLDAIGALHPRGAVDAARYRPNLVLDLPGTPGFAENRWTGRTLELGHEVVLEVIVPTPRCAIPTLAHGGEPRDPDALRVLHAHNVVEIEGFGTAACAGAYARVVRAGRVRRGDAVRLA